MGCFDLHVHSEYCDGCDSLRDIVLKAIELKMDSIGLLHHSYAPFDTSSIKKEKIEDFKREVINLKEEFKDKIKILMGVELDLYSDEDIKDFDYSIGSVHFYNNGNEYYPIDLSFDELKSIVDNYFNGNFIEYSKEYFKNVKEVSDRGVTIIGHLDLLTKFNEIHHYLDEENSEYVKAWKDTVDHILKNNQIFEINTGAISRGYRTTPYPSLKMIDYIKENGGKLILSSDAHKKENLIYKFSEFEKLI